MARLRESLRCCMSWRGAEVPRCLRRISTYPMVWNALNYTACAFPVTVVDPAQDVLQPRTEFLSKADKENYEACGCLAALTLFPMHSIFICSTRFRHTGNVQERACRIAARRTDLGGRSGHCHDGDRRPLREDGSGCYGYGSSYGLSDPVVKNVMSSMSVRIRGLNHVYVLVHRGCAQCDENVHQRRHVGNSSSTCLVHEDGSAAHAASYTHASAEEWRVPATQFCKAGDYLTSTSW